jgi:carbon monoxide dehydrogenase subunit G
MSELARDRVVVAATPDAIRAVIDDPTALARVLPGAESLEPDGPGRWRGILATRLGFITVRADAVATLIDVAQPTQLRIEIEGRPRGLAGSFRASIPFSLEPVDHDRTAIDYVVDLTVTGRLAAFGAPILRDTLRRQVAELVTNLERAATTMDPGSRDG